MRTVRFVMTGPPTADAGAFVGIFDEDGNRVEVGWWEHDGRNHVYVMPVRMVPELMTPPGVEVETLPARESVRSNEPMNDGLAARRALKERLAGRQKVKSEESKVESAPPGHVPAPCCGQPHDPNEELLDCGHCGEPKCGTCLPNATAPCVDCAALAAGKEENEFQGSAPPAARLFDGEFHPDKKAVERAEAEGVLVEEDEG